MAESQQFVSPTTNQFGIADYVVFSLFLLVSAGIGIFFSCTGGRQKTTKEYLMGNRNMSLIPVSISILVSFTSAILILGSPSEMYLNGTLYMIYSFGMAAGCLLAAIIFVPLFFPLKITSAFEYLELRFESRAVRLVGNFLYLLKGIVYMGIAMYAPSTAFKIVTGVPTWVSIIMCGVVGTFYTCLGGLKAVVWTDVFQAGVMLAGILGIIIRGMVDVGGITPVLDIAEQYKRVQFQEWSFDPRVRHTFWGLTLGSAIGWLGTFGVNQASVQRYCSLPTLSKARWCVILNIPGALILSWGSCFSGLVIFGYYLSRGCDVFEAGYTNGNKNQIVPYFVMDRLAVPCVPGIFIAALFSGALSSISSSLNACSAIVWKDILAPGLCKNVPESSATWITKGLVLFFGILGTIVGYLAINLGGTVLQASLAFSGAIGGPSLGLFMLGAFFPHANWLGGCVGSLSGLALSLWVSIGAYSLQKQEVQLYHTNTTMCAPSNWTLNSTTTSTTTAFPMPLSTVEPKHALDDFYSISYLWYPMIGTLSTILIGLLVSAIWSPSRRTEVDPRLVIPVFHNLCCCCPRSCKTAADCGIDPDHDFDLDHNFDDLVEKEVDDSV